MTPSLICQQCSAETALGGETTTCRGCGTEYKTGELSGRASGRQRGTSEEWRVRDFYRRMGCAPYKLSQPQRAKMSKGVPDFYVFRADCRLDVPAAAWWHEVKAGSAIPSPEQRQFLALCDQASVPYVVGDAVAAAEFLGLET